MPNLIRFITMQLINEKLGPNQALLNITSMTNNKFIKAYADFNETHLTVSVDLPVIRKKGFNISELVPLPMEENGKEVLLFPNEEVKNSLCKMQDGLTICNTFLEDYYTVASDCLQ